jgi:endo-alpha-1,4-polygalactosaminidase (GH114 family)
MLEKLYFVIAYRMNSACNSYRGYWKKKKKKTCLARGEELLVAFLVVLGSLACG